MLEQKHPFQVVHHIFFVVQTRISVQYIEINQQVFSCYTFIPIPSFPLS